MEIGPFDPWRYFLNDASVNKISGGRTRMPLNECEAICGPEYTRYPDSNIIKGAALWLIPVFVLVGNFQFPPLGPLNSFYIAIHLLGDPIHTVYSLLVKPAQ